jgi:UDP-N-acetylglucosamine--N-acetylmuramyl-(pentapeptide) pyrophosphoryl-undecaprenol N-acetylglucosamine transferase
MEYRALRVIISGGGTGGHIFPAVSIAGKLKELNPDTEILFVGAEGRMEMEKVPAAGYKIVGLPIAGLQRQLTLHNIKENLKLPFKILQSLRKAGRLIDEFKPDIAIGVGGYASAPLLWKATRKGVPALIQEQNGFAGLTNRLLGRRVKRICVAYEGMSKFFPEDRIVLTGNPIRSEIVPATASLKAEGLSYYGLQAANRHILIVGGSLGSRTLNEAMKKWINEGCPGAEGVEILWQCGSFYKKGVDEFMAQHKDLTFIHHSDFIRKMGLAYAASDLIISRSGASSISEICAAHKASVLVPSPNVAEDHQTHNAMALVRRGAAVLVKDVEAGEKLMQTALELVREPEKISEMERNAASLALPGAAMSIAEEVYKILDSNV